MNNLETLTEKLNTIYARVSAINDLKRLLLSIYEYVEVFDTNPELTPVNGAIREMAHADTKYLKELEEKAFHEDY